MRLFQYRGIRVRPWQRKLDIIIPVIFSIILLIPAGLFVFNNLEALKIADTQTIIVAVVLVVVGIALGILLARAFFEMTALGAKVDRQGILSLYCYDHGIYYEKKRSGQNGKSKIKYPKIYMKHRKYDLDVSFEMAGNKFQEKFKKMGGELETSLFMDFMETSDERKFKTYTMAYSAFLNRINVPDVAYTRGKGLKLMENFYWDFDSDPHMIVAGGTGGGKTVLLRSLILGLSKIGVVDICDPKYADFVTMAELDAFKGRVAFTTEDIIETFEKAHVEMMERYRIMNAKRKELKQKELGKYYDYDMKPYFLVCDEFNALMSVIKSGNYKQLERFDNALTQLILKGRQAGVNVILAMQKPSREDLSSKMQANMNMRLVVGRLDEFGYEIMFGEINRTKEFKYIKRLMGKRVYGRGYGAVNGEVAREFYAPNMDRDLVFYDEFAKVERIANPYSYLENPNVNPDIVNNKELQTVIDKSTEQSGHLTVTAGESESRTVKYTLKEVADTIDASRSQVFKVLKLIEDDGYTTFECDENNKKVFSDSEVALVKELFDFKATNNLTWSNAVEQYFTRESED
ncbi:FtsK/SpoIIIE domain-containing protein [Streptococcus agalactiae]|uniref:FtsK/SpoIIIE domain-containing protein n=1 Tax=Streptococcus agalactiae TaxID=1311 RepID=UPI0022EB4EC2|nr:FtsK/SpoIIIE domain-containing protein [Streptococcus agalactiae]